MKTAKEIQQFILDKTGIKVSTKKLTGSMRGYIAFSPMFQNGDYPKFSHDFRQEVKKLFPTGEPKPTFTSETQIDIFGIDISEVIKFTKERKPKNIEQMKGRTWGSKNSQLRLDKASSRYANKIRDGKDIARYN